MFRRDLIELLRAQPRGVTELARLLDMEPKDVKDDLRHLLRSLKSAGVHVVIDPARCRHCGFAFHKDKLAKPGKCPACRHTWITEPRIRITGDAHA